METHLYALQNREGPYLSLFLCGNAVGRGSSRDVHLTIETHYPRVHEFDRVAELRVCLLFTANLVLRPTRNGEYERVIFAPECQDSPLPKTKKHFELVYMVKISHLVEAA